MFNIVIWKEASSICKGFIDGAQLLKKCLVWHIKFGENVRYWNYWLNYRLLLKFSLQRLLPTMLMSYVADFYYSENWDIYRTLIYFLPKVIVENIVTIFVDNIGGSSYKCTYGD